MRHNFTEAVKKEVLYRQGFVCACCGESLDDEIDRAHHVVPDQTRRGRPGDAFINSADNCVYLCLLCHDIVHDGGRMRYGPTAPPSYFRHSHARLDEEADAFVDDRDAHSVWVDRMDLLIARKYRSRWR